MRPTSGWCNNAHSHIIIHVNTWQTSLRHVQWHSTGGVHAQSHMLAHDTAAGRHAHRHGQGEAYSSDFIAVFSAIASAIARHSSSLTLQFCKLRNTKAGGKSWVI